MSQGLKASSNHSRTRGVEKELGEFYGAHSSRYWIFKFNSDAHINSENMLVKILDGVEFVQLNWIEIK